tara:strand:- start:2515 stop:2727 length:213 start_codon:yes stop_codon:yes gene_type:complete
MKPTDKSPEIDAFLTHLTGVDRKVSIEAATCTTCTGTATTFRDELSRKEFSISGMCQACQDAIYGINFED